MSKFIQILHVPEDRFWALDEDGNIWESEDDHSKTQPVWNRLKMKKSGTSPTTQTKPTAMIHGAEAFRKVVLNHLRNIQNDPSAPFLVGLPRSESAGPIRVVIRNLLDQIEQIEILEALGLK